MKTLLAQVGDRVTVPAMDSQRLWQLGRRKRRLDRIRAAAAALAAIALAGLPFLSTVPPMPAEEAIELPAVFEAAYLWQASVADSPNGPAVAVLMDTPHLFGQELSEDLPAAGVVGRDGSYRLRWSGSRSDPVTADGRFLATGNKIVDLANGETRPYADRHLTPLAWSRDGRYLAATDRLPGSVENATIFLYDTMTGSARELAQSGGPVSQAAFSPDGVRLAVLSQGALKVIDTADGSAVNARGVSPGTQLAVPAAWTPDGAAVALIAKTACRGHAYGWDIDGERYDSRAGCEPAAVGDDIRWRLHLFQVATGDYAVYPDNGHEHPGYAYGVAGWRGTDPVVAVYHHGQRYRSSLVRLTPDDRLETLTKADTRLLQVPQNLVEQHQFGDHIAAPSIFAAHPAAYGFVAAMLLAVTLPIVWIRRRRMRRRRRQVPHTDGGRTG